MPPSMAGLPDWRAWVFVAPPLFASGPSRGLVLRRSLASVNWQPVLLSRLPPDDVNVPPELLQLPPLPFATIVLRKVTPPPALNTLPPLPNGVVLPFSVTLVSVATPPTLASTPATLGPAEFTLIVLLTMLMSFWDQIPPPPDAELPSIVVRFTAGVDGLA